MTGGRVDQESVPIILRDHRARIRALEALSPLATISVLPYCFCGGEIRTSVPDSTPTPVLCNFGFVSETGTPFFDVSGQNSLTPTGIISVLETGFYLLLGFVVFNDPVSGWDASLSWDAPLINLEDDPSGNSYANSIAGSIPASVTDFPQGMQAIALYNLEGTPPFNVTMNAFQNSGIDRATINIGQAIVRIGECVHTGI